MTIKKDCVVKYLKHDFKEIGIASGVIIAVVVILFVISQFTITANSLFDIISGIIILSFTFGVAHWWNYSTFRFLECGYGGPLLIALVCEVVIGIIYCVIGNYPSVRYDIISILPDLLVSIILLVIGVPIASAIARCKE